MPAECGLDCIVTDTQMEASKRRGNTNCTGKMIQSRHRGPLKAICCAHRLLSLGTEFPCEVE